MDKQDFDSQEMDHDLAFVAYIKRVCCMSHTLQLIAYKFDNIKSFKMVLASVHALVKKVNKSSKATERLLALCSR